VSVRGYIAFDYAAIASYAVISWARDQYNCTEFALATLLLSDLLTAFYVLVTYSSATYGLPCVTPEAESGSTLAPKDATVSTVTSATGLHANCEDTTHSGTAVLGSGRGMTMPLAQMPMVGSLEKYIRYLTIFCAILGALVGLVAIAGCRSSCHSIEMKSFTSTLCAAIGLAKLSVLGILVTNQTLPTWLKKRGRLPDSTFPATFRVLWFLCLLITIIMILAVNETDLTPGSKPIALRKEHYKNLMETEYFIL